MMKYKNKELLQDNNNKKCHCVRYERIFFEMMLMNLTDFTLTSNVSSVRRLFFLVASSWAYVWCIKVRQWHSFMFFYYYDFFFFFFIAIHRLSFFCNSNLFELFEHHLGGKRQKSSQPNKIYYLYIIVICACLRFHRKPFMYVWWVCMYVFTVYR